MTHRHQLPQSEGYLFLTDGGIETTLIFHEGLDLPHFAAFHLLRSPEGTEALRAYFRTYARLARRLGTGLVLESATWRANRDWAKLLGYSPADLAHANRRAVELLEEIRDGMSAHVAPVVISGCVGPRGDGYRVDEAMSAAEAAAYHAEQIETFQGSAADMASAITMTYVDEAVGVARAARAAGMPVSISFTVDADTGGYPAYYMVNCAHPMHFMHVLDPDAGWTDRIGGLRANASRMSHAELDESPTLDEGDPVELAEQYAELVRALPGVTVLGGCCGTDHRHVERIGRVCKPLLESTQVSLGT
jgi:S-methylmethionine-dependent homocysteine/selenocysteine methylase